jgi:hypothetical protein
VQERQPEVVVLHVEALAHASGKLVDEAEHTLVTAGRDISGPRRLQLDPEIGAAPDERGARAPAIPVDLQA